jgi:hypothetical protein
MVRPWVAAWFNGRSFFIRFFASIDFFLTLLPSSLPFDFKMRKKRAVKTQTLPFRKEKNTVMLIAFAK